MSEQKTIYAGNGKKINSTYGTFRSVSVCLTDLPQEHMSKGKNGKTYITLNVNDKDQVDQYGNDVVVSVNTFKPDPNKVKGNEQTQAENIGLPF